MLPVSYLTNNIFSVVDIFQSQDRSCPGMKASVTCITTTVNGYLQWIINNVPVFIVNSGETASFNQTINGSEFVFVRGVSAFGVNVYTSTVSLNTGQTTSICCSDGFLKQTLDIGFVGKSMQCFNICSVSKLILYRHTSWHDTIE